MDFYMVVHEDHEAMFFGEPEFIDSRADAEKRQADLAAKLAEKIAADPRYKGHEIALFSVERIVR